MSEEADEESGPAVSLGDTATVEGAPIARIASRLQWGMAKSEVADREGGHEIRTPNGPRPLAEILEDVEVPYFETRQEFIAAVEDAIGRGPVPSTADENGDTASETENEDSTTSSAEADNNEGE